MNRNFLTTAFTVFALSFSSVSMAQDLGYDDDNSVVWVEGADQEMNAAMAKAKETIHNFWTRKDSGDAAYRDFSLKVALETSGGSLEHIWVNQISKDGNAMTGLLGNDPIDIPNVVYGDKVSFTAEQISDWQYMKNDKLFGHYTTRVMINRMPPDEAQLYSQMMGENP